MKNFSNTIFWFLRFMAWVIFIGLSIELGSLLVNFYFSIFDPEKISVLYQKMNLRPLYETNQSIFYAIYSFILIISLLKATLFYKVTELMTKLNLSNPFSYFVSKNILNLSYYTISIGLISFIAKNYMKNLSHKFMLPPTIDKFWVDSEAFILMGAVIYIIAMIFKKGVALQNENDLTV